MKHKNVINNVMYELDDGDEETADITELHGELAEQADDEMVAGWIEGLKKRGYKIIPPGKWGEKDAWFDAFAGAD